MCPLSLSRVLPPLVSPPLFNSHCSSLAFGNHTSLPEASKTHIVRLFGNYSLPKLCVQGQSVHNKLGTQLTDLCVCGLSLTSSVSWGKQLRSPCLELFFCEMGVKAPPMSYQPVRLGVWKSPGALATRLSSQQFLPTGVQSNERDLV